jgi:hypothetical protein
MRVDTCLVCEAASVHDGLLNVLGGGITQVNCGEFPAELGVSLALRIMVHPTEVAHPHQLEIVLQSEDGEQVTKVDVQLRTDPDVDLPDIPAGEEPEILMAWNFPGHPRLPREGRYSFELLIDGVHQASMPLKAVLIGGEQ